MASIPHLELKRGGKDVFMIFIVPARALVSSDPWSPDVGAAVCGLWPASRSGALSAEAAGAIQLLLIKMCKMETS